MKTLKVEEFSAKSSDHSAQLVEFVNKNKIQKEDIVNIVFESTLAKLLLFYYS
jgi:hypothetical protein